MKKSYLKHITALLMFGLNGIVASHIQLTSYHIVLLRTLLGGALLTVIFLMSGRCFTFYKSRKDCFYIIVSGAAMGASWMFLYEAYAQVGVSIASLLYYCGPVVVMILSPLLFGERLTAAKLAGFAAVLCGVFLVNGQSAGELNAFGLACGLLSALTYAIMVIANKKVESITGMENSALQLVISFITVGIFVGIKNGGYALPIVPGDIVWILVLGIINTGLGCYFYFSSIGHLPVQSVSVLGYLEPLSAVAFSVILLGERMTALQLLGGGMIIGGAIFGECVKKRPEIQEI